MRRAPLPLLLSVLVLIGSACPPGQQGTDTDTSTSTGGSSTGGSTASPTGGDACDPLPAATDDCCCLTLDVPGAKLQNACPADATCDPVTIACSLEDPDCPIPTGGMGTAGAVTVSDAAALDCILGALRDGTPGTLSWAFEDMESSGKFRRETTHIVRADRSAFTLDVDRADTKVTVGDLTLAPLKPATDFTACLAEVDIKAKALCLTAATGMATETCAMGG